MPIVCPVCALCVTSVCPLCDLCVPSRRGQEQQEQIVVAPSTPAMNTLAAQLTEDNEDFASRGRYHQSEVMQGDNFDDYNSE